MFYCIYKITNKTDGKIYIGSHKTKNLDDSYMGSGKYLKYAQEKYGIENFTKEILFVFDTAEQMYAKEAELVNEEFIATENTYNLKVGGFGGFDYVNANELNTSWKSPEDRSAKISSTIKHKLDSDQLELSDKFKSNSGIRPNSFIEKAKEGAFRGKKHTHETKSKIGKKISIVQAGVQNSQFGTMWITNEKDNMKIPKDGIIPTGWRKGRRLSGKQEPQSKRR